MNIQKPFALDCFLLSTVTGLSEFSNRKEDNGVPELRSSIVELILKDKTVNDLVRVLDEIESDTDITETIPFTDHADGCYSDTDLPLLVQLAMRLANAFLITPTGDCYWKNHRVLKDAGFNVTAGEKDSFGWLTGVIRTSKGIIVYG